MVEQLGDDLEGRLAHLNNIKVIKAKASLITRITYNPYSTPNTRHPPTIFPQHNFEQPYGDMPEKSIM